MATRTAENIKTDTRFKAELYWIPLGTGGHFLKYIGWITESVKAVVHRHKRQDLYHTALRVTTPEGAYFIEQAPTERGPGNTRGVVSEGPVFMRQLGSIKFFRYENRCWFNGSIPDIAFAVGGPIIVTQSEDKVRNILDSIRKVPTPTWGRDENALGEMWNSNSVISWVLTTSGIDLNSVLPPDSGRGPGWEAGKILALRTSSADKN